MKDIIKKRIVPEKVISFCGGCPYNQNNHEWCSFKRNTWRELTEKDVTSFPSWCPLKEVE